MKLSYYDKQSLEEAISSLRFGSFNQHASTQPDTEDIMNIVNQDSINDDDISIQHQQREDIDIK